MSIDDGGSETYHVQLIQNDLLIENGKYYTLSFDAYADGPREISVSIQHSSKPWTIYHAFFNLNVTATKQTYRTSFSMSDPTDSLTQLVFDMGLSESDVHLDNISLSLQTPFKRGFNLSGWFQQFPPFLYMDFKKYSKESFEDVKLLGCDHIRLPLELFDIVGSAPGYVIPPIFFTFLDQAVDWAEQLIRNPSPRAPRAVK